MILLAGGVAPAAEPESEPTGALAWFKRGVKVAREGDIKAALSRFKRARSLAPNWALPHLEIAVAHMMTDNDRKVIGRSLAEAVRLGKELPRAHYLYGIYHQELGKRAEAISEFTYALRLRPSLAKARFRLAVLYIEEGRQVDGIEQLQLLIKQKPAHVGAHRNLAVLYEQSGRLEDAGRHLYAIAKLFPSNAFFLTELGRFYQRAGWEKKAQAAFRKADRLDSPRGKRKMRPLLRTRERKRPRAPDLES